MCKYICDVSINFSYVEKFKGVEKTKLHLNLLF
jgi:hypothetical protein